MRVFSAIGVFITACAMGTAARGIVLKLDLGKDAALMAAFVVAITVGIVLFSYFIDPSERPRKPPEPPA